MGDSCSAAFFPPRPPPRRRRRHARLLGAVAVASALLALGAGAAQAHGSDGRGGQQWRSTAAAARRRSRPSEPQTTGAYVYLKKDARKPASWENSTQQYLVATWPGAPGATSRSTEIRAALPAGLTLCGPGWGVQEDKAYGDATRLHREQGAVLPEGLHRLADEENPKGSIFEAKHWELSAMVTVPVPVRRRRRPDATPSPDADGRPPTPTPTADADRRRRRPTPPAPTPTPSVTPTPVAEVDDDADAHVDRRRTPTPTPDADADRRRRGAPTPTPTPERDRSTPRSWPPAAPAVRRSPRPGRPRCRACSPAGSWCSRVPPCSCCGAAAPADRAQEGRRRRRRRPSVVVRRAVRGGECGGRHSAGAARPGAVSSPGPDGVRLSVGCAPGSRGALYPRCPSTDSHHVRPPPAPGRGRPIVG